MTSKYVTLEHADKTLPSLLLLDFTGGKRNHLLELTAKFFAAKAKTYVLTKKKVPNNAESISSLSVHFLDRLNGSLPYALFFIDSEGDKKNILFALRKVTSQNTKIILLVPRRQVSLFIDILLEIKNHPYVYAVLIGDIFGAQSLHTTLSKTIEEALVYHTVSVSQTAIIPIFPLSDSDFLNLVAHILFGNANPNILFKGYYNNPQTFLSLAHVLKRYEPELSVEFKSAEISKGNNTIPFMYDRTIKERLGALPETIPGVFLGFTKSMVFMEDKFSAIVPSKEIKQKKRKKSPKKIKQLLKRFFVFFLTGFLTYITVIVILFIISILLFRQGAMQLLAGKTEAAISTLTISKSVYDLSSQNTRILLSLPSVAFMNSLKNYVNIYDELQVSTLPAVITLSGVAHDKKISDKNVTLLESFMRDFYFFVQKQNNKNINLIGDKNFSSLSNFLPLMQTFKVLGGYDKERSYLILLQNSNELRPTGGFIGSVAYVTVKDGQIMSNNVQEVYDLDGQLKGHVEPHYIIRRNLQPNLYLRDSNFNPDFNISASASAFLYTTESGKEVNGVIGIDTYVLKELIKIAGPIQLPGQARKLTPENATSLLQDSIQNEFFPGSIEKKQILNSLMSKILVTIESDTQKQVRLAQILPKLLEEKHILFSFPNQSIQKVFNAAGYAGSMNDTRIQSKNVLDSLSINEANIGVNKANELVSRSISYSAFLHPDEVLSDAQLSLDNKSPDDYRAYIRFIVPEDAILTGITINGAPQDLVSAVTDPNVFERKVFKAPVGLEVDQVVQNGKKMIGFIVNTPLSSQSRIHVLYKIPYKGFTKDTFDYSLLYVKQPGTKEHQLTVQLEADDRFNIKSKQTSVVFNGIVSTDKEFTEKIQRVKE